MNGVLNLVGIQKKDDFLYGLPVAMRYYREERGNLTYGNFRPFTGSLNWQTFEDVKTSLEKEVYFRCREVAEITEMKNPRKEACVWISEHASMLVAKLMYLCNDIAITTALGQGNVIILNSKFYDLLYKLTFSFADAPFINVLNGDNGNLTICGRDTFKLDFDDNSNYPEALIAYHSNQSTLNGVILGVNSEDNTYAICSDIQGTGNFYRLLRITDEF
jgi:hypothetical protein